MYNVVGEKKRVREEERETCLKVNIMGGGGGGGIWLDIDCIQKREREKKK